MVSGVSEWPAKAPSPALGLCVPIAPAVACRRSPRLRVLNTKKAHRDLPAVSEIARVRCQCLRLQCGSVRIV
jgi:hypothetical protein